jgi:HEAT repeat protein
MKTSPPPYLAFLLLLVSVASAGESVLDLKMRLSSGDEDRRIEALEGLARHGRRAASALPEVVDLCVTSDRRVQEVAFRTLGKIGGGPEKLRPRLVRGLSSEEEDVRARSAWGLFLLGPDAAPAAKEIRAALTDSSELVRLSVLVALLEIDEEVKDAKEVLTKATTSEAAEIRARALIGIGYLPGVELPYFRKALSDPEPAVRLAAAKGLFGLGVGAKEALPEITKAIGDADYDVRKYAIAAAARMAALAKDAVPALVTGLSHRSAKFRLLSARALGRFGVHAKPAVRPLLLALGDDDPEVMTAAAKSLGMLGATAVPGLAKALTEEAEWQNRQYAATVLGAIAGVAKPAIPALRKALADPNEAVRDAAALALRKIEDE